MGGVCQRVSLTDVRARASPSVFAMLLIVLDLLPQAD
jgi:hypothetical protein